MAHKECVYFLPLVSVVDGVKVSDPAPSNNTELSIDTREAPPVLLKNKLEDKGPDIYSLPKIH